MGCQQRIFVYAPLWDVLPAADWGHRLHWLLLSLAHLPKCLWLPLANMTRANYAYDIAFNKHCNLPAAPRDQYICYRWRSDLAMAAICDR